MRLSNVFSLVSTILHAVASCASKTGEPAGRELSQCNARQNLVDSWLEQHDIYLLSAAG